MNRQGWTIEGYARALDQAEAERDRNLRNSREAKKRAIRAEARIKAVRDVLDRHKADGLNPYALDVDIRRALDN